MTIRLLRYETRRYAAAARGPLLVLLVLLVLLALSVARPVVDGLLTGPPGGQLPVAPAGGVVTYLLGTLGSVAVLAGSAWLGAAIVRAAPQPGRDAEAAGHLQSLRDRAVIEGRDLVEIDTRWATQAGQQAVAINVCTGAVGDVWLPEVRLPDGAFALLARDGESAAIAAWASPEQVTATHRHQRPVAVRKPSRGQRHSDKDGRAMVAEAEALVRGEG
ncbi:MAG: hypothetical protein IPL45_00190 [Actinomycetales bacterium]|nr:hypothetical protein [Actinomycetales bacterium]